MNSQDDVVLLALNFTLFSLLSIGGVVPILPEIHRTVVEVNGWMSSEAFVTYFALAQAAPGPNVMVVTLIGWHVAGLAGALAATVGILGPAGALTYVASKAWARWNRFPWYRTFERGVVPVTIGLILAGGWLLTSAAATSPASYVVTAATAALVLLTRVHPLFALGMAAALGYAGLV
jgi:chromate transporter